MFRLLQRGIGINWHYSPFVSNSVVQNYLDRKIDFEKEGDVYLAEGQFPLRDNIDWWMPEDDADRALWCADFLKYYERFESWLGSGDKVVEVGAATGEFTVEAAKQIRATGQLYAFETDPLNFTCMQKNVEKEGLQNVVAENEAVSGTSGETLEFMLNTNSLTGHRFRTTQNDDIDPEEEDGWELVTKETVSIDDYCDQNGIDELTMIKLTVNGHETKILRGATEMLEKTTYVALADAYPDAISLLNEYGFDIESQYKHPRSLVGPTLLKNSKK